MKLILLTAEECDICHDAEELFKKEFAKELASGEAEIKNLDIDAEAQEMWMELDLPLAPTVILMSDDKKVIASVEPNDLIKEIPKAKAAGEPAVKQS